MRRSWSLSAALSSYLLLVLYCTGPSSALYLNGLFSDNAILQIEREEITAPQARIYGSTFLNETVKITGTNGFPSLQAKPVATPDSAPDEGQWSVTVPAPTNGKTGPFDITVTSLDATGKATNSSEFGNVFFGDVIVCSGQSNMELSVRATDNGTEEIAAASQYESIHLFNVVHNESNSSITTIAGTWNVSSNASVPNFSAVCYITGRMLTDWLRVIYPDTVMHVGLIESNIGGTTVHFWAPPDVGLACNKTGMLPWQGECAQHVAGWLWNAMINPMSMSGQGYAIMAAMYYQGEADSGENDHMSTAAYTCELANMIRFWRKEWNQPAMPFVNVQLPGGGYGGCSPGNYDDGLTSWVGIRAAQQRTSRLVPHTGMVVSVDQGGALHYPHKSEVAHRASLWIRQLAYADSKANAQGPTFLYATKATPDAMEVKLHFHVTNGPLKLASAWTCEKVKPCTWPAVNVTCCDGNAPSIVSVRLHGIYYHTDRPGHHGGNISETWSWVPATIDLDAASSTATAKPMLPPVGTKGWPVYYSTYLGTEAFSIEAVVVNANGRPGCAIVDASGIPVGTYESTPVLVVPE
ncbi:sialate O-acetylesterase-like [Sycon ciliatum]|uniref:sialate O-acetylesterase-like n=1 Tax=Sycon ciliatum TaxID=27933 RepID=UPI0031F6EFD9|eukprot:scpid34964/ scgid16456/ Sialate O-acetylesterase; Sialic acid-specific 9-O-acetylesterase; Yolk sac protein 2; Sialate O-acetylesterase small subunit; Sialate O-acetylesterase large subunit